MSRLDYAPKLKEIQITDIKAGLGVFIPKPDRNVSFAALKDALKKAGYTLDKAEIVVSGTLARDGKGWWVVAEPSGQRFALEGPSVDKVLAGASLGAPVEVTGDWKSAGENATAREVISPRALKQRAVAKASTVGAKIFSETGAAVFTRAGFDASKINSFGNSIESVSKPLAPIRTTTPGLTVYKGGAITPRLYLIEQHLGNLQVSRQQLDMSVSYTPTPRVQLEVEVPLTRTAFDDGVTSGASSGFGNVTLWGKYRFYRTVKTYGDRQAAVRFGLELPTGKRNAPTRQQVNAPDFVRQQLTAISGGLSPHFDAAFSQAGGRFIFGGNVEGVLRSERDGFRLGHELRVNTDLEYVLLPFDYSAPGRELFIILETNLVRRGRGHTGGTAVTGSEATEVYLSPGLQYAADPRFVIEGSAQIPILRRTGPQLLRTDSNILLGVRYLF